MGIYKPVILADFLYNVATPGIDPVIPQVRIISDHGKKFLTIDVYKRQIHTRAEYGLTARPCIRQAAPEQTKVKTLL